MRLQEVLFLLWGVTLAAPNAATPVDIPVVDTVVAPAEGTDENIREKRQWVPNAGFNPNPFGGFNPNFGGVNPNFGGANPNFGGVNPNFGDFYPRQWWGNNYANYGPNGGFGGRSGSPPFAGFGMNPNDYMQQMQWFYNNFPDVIDTGASNNLFPMPMLSYMYQNGYAPPMRQSNQQNFQRSWQQYYQQTLRMMTGNGFNFGPQGGFSQPNMPFGPDNNSDRPGSTSDNNGSPSQGNKFGSDSSSPGINVDDRFGAESFGSSGNSDNTFGSDNSFGSSGNSDNTFGSNSFGSPGNSDDGFGSFTS